MPNEPKPDAKVRITTIDEEGEAFSETLWATTVGTDLYRLDNSPFGAYNVSWEDVVYAPFDAETGFAEFQEVRTKSGNRTVRIIFNKGIAPGNKSDLILQELHEFGCSYEGMNPKFVALTVPSDIDLKSITSHLQKLGLEWEYADPSYDVLFPND